MNVLPELEEGGNDPVVIAFKHSIMVVLPAPLWPKIRVSGFWNLIIAYVYKLFSSLYY